MSWLRKSVTLIQSAGNIGRWCVRWTPTQKLLFFFKFFFIIIMSGYLPSKLYLKIYKKIPEIIYADFFFSPTLVGAKKKKKKKIPVRAKTLYTKKYYCTEKKKKKKNPDFLYFYYLFELAVFSCDVGEGTYDPTEVVRIRAVIKPVLLA